MLTSEDGSSWSGSARSVDVHADDGFRLAVTVYEPEDAIVANVLIHGAMATPQRFYRRFAGYLAGAGYRVITYDYRGIGGSRPGAVRDVDATLTDWAARDARAMHTYVREHFGGLPLGIVGHSFGGQLIGLVEETREADAAVFVGAQLGYYKHWPLAWSLALMAVWRAVVPALSNWFGYLPAAAGLGVDVPAGVAKQWARWCSHPNYLISEYPEAEARYEQFDRPLLFYSFTDDFYAPSRAVQSFLQHLPIGALTHRRVAPSDLSLREIGHFGFFRGRTQTPLWDEARTFLGSHLALR